ncbi:MAG: hypothetical protein ACE5LB_14985 [Acidiferrobacterales bacterium]
MSGIGGGSGGVQTGGAAGGVGVSQPRTIFVYRPDDPAGARENVYTDWATLVAAIANVEGNKAIEFDNAFQNPVVLPTGSFDMSGVEWCGVPGSPGATAVTIPGGATFTGLRRFRRILMTYTGVGATVPITDTGVIDLFAFDDFAEIICTGDTAFMDIGSSFLALLFITEGSRIVGTGGASAVEPITLSGAGTTQITLGQSGTLQDESLDGTGDAQLILLDATGNPQTLTHSNYSGSFSFQTQPYAGWRLTPLLGGAVVGATTAKHSEEIPCDPTGGGFTVTLPPSSLGQKGQPVVVKNRSASTNVITIAPDGPSGDVINGATTIAVAQGSLTFLDTGEGEWDQI